MSNLRVIKESSNERIVTILEDLLAEAKRGEVTGLFLFSEGKNGGVTHSRDGMSDALIMFWVELIKRRILGAYEP
jgi:hypothetical protein